MSSPGDSSSGVIISSPGDSSSDVISFLKTILSRTLQISWKIMTKSLFYGLIVHISIIEAKTLLCRFSQQFMSKIKPVNFWIILGLITVAFVLLNLVVSKYLRDQIFSGRQKLKGSRFGTITRHWTSKKTRSGRIYGYM